MSAVAANTGFMAVIEFQILPRWFELDSRTQRDYANQLARLLRRYETVESRWFDADAWTGEFSDFVICEFEDLDAYNELWSEMRRHPFLATPYARIGHVLMGMELETQGLASLAEPEASGPAPSLERPPETPKPAKSEAPSQPQLPPQVAKPTKRFKKAGRDTDELEHRACHHCGHQMKSSARFCSRCGTAGLED